MKSKFFRFFIMIMCAMGIGVSAAGCGFGIFGGAGSDTAVETTEVSTENDGNKDKKEEITEAPVVSFSEQEAEAAFRSLFEKALACVKNDDKEGFKNLFVFDEETEETNEYINGNYDNLKKYISDAYPITRYYIIGGDGKAFGAGIRNSIVSGRYPDFRCMYHNLYYPISCKKGDWAFDFTSETGEAIYKATEGVYPEECVAASKDGRNCVDFSNGADYTWTRENITVPGSIDANVYLAWQNQDGSVEMLLNVKNGTDEVRSIYNYDITFTDDSLGEILNISRSGDMLAPGTSRNYVVKADPSEVKTGMEKWGSVHVDVHRRSD